MLALIHGLTLTGISFIWKIERQWDDLLIRAPSFLPFLHTNTSHLHSKVVAIDGRTLIQYGFPLKRSIYADAADSLAKAKSGPVSFDVIFGASDDYAGSLKLSQSLSALSNTTLAAITSAQWTPARKLWNDSFEQSAISSRPSYLSEKFQSIALDGPWPPVADAVTRIALTDSEPDSDGNLRWYELIHPGPQGYLPSLALSEFLANTGQTAEVDLDSSGRISKLKLLRDNVIQSEIPLWDDPEGKGRIPLLPIAKSGLLPDLSFTDLVSGNPDVLAQLRDQAVFIGTTLDGARPIQPTPLDPLQAAIHNHQAAFESLSTGNILHRGVVARIIEILLTLGAVLIYSGLIPITVFKQTLAERLYFGLSLILKVVFFKFGIWAHISPALLAIGTLRSASLMDEYDRSEKQRRFLKDAFSNYLSPELVGEMLENPEKVALGGEERRLVILFCDLRGYTSLSEGLAPSLVMKMMNQYFEMVSDQVIRNGGTVDKFIGDAVMAFWGAPVIVDDPERKATVAARGIQDGVAQLAKLWSEELGRSVSVQVGVGVHSGQALVGNVGGKSRFNYTAMGDAVNLASRIESITKQYGVSILISGDVVAALPNSGEWLKIDRVNVAGKKVHVDLFTESQADAELDQRYLAAFELYTKADFVAAELAFKSLNYGPALRLAKRCKEFQKVPPLDWTGVASLEK
jgi:adenylate cyclase